MLIITRYVGKKIIINDNIIIHVKSIIDEKVDFEITAPPEIIIKKIENSKYDSYSIGDNIMICHFGVGIGENYTNRPYTRFGIIAPKNIRIDREEIHDIKKRRNQHLNLAPILEETI
jgi:sRNA-binding carbon storage regulator CsrA